jgi:hypothetical protein
MPEKGDAIRGGGAKMPGNIPWARGEFSRNQLRQAAFLWRLSGK